MRVACHPAIERAIGRAQRSLGRPALKGRRGKIRLDALDLLLGQLERAVADARPLFLDLGTEGLRAHLVHKDLDARLVLVVAAAMQIVHAQNRLEVAEQILFRQLVADLFGDQRCAALAAADVDGKAQTAISEPLQMQADVVHLDGGPVVLGGGDSHLELARQEAELGVQRRPLPDDLRVRARVGHLVGASAGEMVGGDVADAVARGLDGVHLDIGQLLQDVGDVGELGPVELEVLPRGEVAVAPVVYPGNVRELTHLSRRQRAVGDGNAQHVGVQLQIDAVHQPQGLELVLGELARDSAAHLIAELRHPLAHELRIELIVAIHGRQAASTSGSLSPLAGRGLG